MKQETERLRPILRHHKLLGKRSHELPSIGERGRKKGGKGEEGKPPNGALCHSTKTSAYYGVDDLSYKQQQLPVFVLYFTLRGDPPVAASLGGSRRSSAAATR